MRISISNIAWETSDDEAVAALMRRYQIDAIDVAPGKYFADFAKTTDDEIAQVRQTWKGRGFDIVGMQSLLYGTQGLNLFGGTAIQIAMLEHLDSVCRIGAGLGATRLVFGSPKNRDRTGLDENQAEDIATTFFSRLAEIAARYQVTICLEPNPSVYGCNFMTDAAATARVVRRVGHRHIRMQLDTGALTLNQEDPDRVLAESAELIGHIHLSEPQLLPLGRGNTDHRSIAKALAKAPQHTLGTIEMLSPKGESLTAIEEAIRVAIDAYRSDGPHQGAAV